MRYHNFDLWIDSRLEGKYPLRAASETHGEARDFLSLESHAADIEEAERKLDQRQTDSKLLVDLGTRLYTCLFRSGAGAIEDLLNQTWGAVQGAEDEGLRLRIRIEAPEIAALPWEFLYSPRMQCFVGTSVRLPLVRYLELSEPIRELATPLPVKMLVVIPDSPGLNAETEKKNLSSALEGLETQVELTVLEGNVTRASLSDALLENRFHIFHFIGHGDFHDQQAFLQLNSEGGDVDYIDHAQLAGLFLNHPSMKLVVLNSCKGAEVSSSKPFVGMAPQLVRRGVPAVVAMQYAIYDDVAILFAKEFYRSLFRGWNSGRVEVAMSHARNRLTMEFPNDRDLGAPVLFMRAREGVLFNVAHGHRLPLSKKELESAKAAVRAHEHNIAILEQRRNGALEETLLASEREELRSLKQRLRFRNATIVASVGIAWIASVLAVMSAFDFLTLDTKVESYTIWVGNLLVERNFSPDLVLLAVGRDIDRAAWRRQHALVVDKLSQAGAKVIAFDMFFESSTPHDDELRRAIDRARKRGTHVVVGARSLSGGQPKLVEELRGAVSGWGALCLGTKLGYAWIEPVAIVKDSTGVVSSLALGAMAAFQDLTVVHVDQRYNQILAENRKAGSAQAIPVSDTGKIENVRSSCPIITGKATIASLMIDLSPIQLLRDPVRRYNYTTVLQSPAGTSPEPFRGKIVLIGAEAEEDNFPVGFGGERRFGFELHADALNTLLSGITIRSVGQSPQFIITLGLALLGGWIRYWKPDAPRRWRISALGLALIAYLLATVYLYSHYRLLLNTVYQVGALVGAYGTAGKVRQRWFH